ncbi:hypothetical protein [Belnapia moabensis]|uniref:hypothetical protein n=1 Tax=Belnapia moabensis TaxID=365533 RepID=UPI0005B7A32D|nr:hypothetical protein [Belnapia moabensis]
MANGAITRDATPGTTLAEARDVFVKRHEVAEHPAMPAAALALGDGEAAPVPRNPWAGVVATRLCRAALALPKAA